MASRYFRFDPSTQSVVEVKKSTTKGIPRYPLALESLAVHPTQVAEAREHDAKNGVKTEYTPDGRPIIRDAGHYRKYRRLHGVHFKNGFTS
jgi:hypothetical protein